MSSASSQYFTHSTPTDMSSPFPADANLKNPVCVFCGSSPGKLPLFTKASQSVGEALAKAGIPLVYGGGRRGIMGVVSNSTLQAGGYVHGIVPRALVERAAEHTPAPGTAAAAPGKGVSGEGTGAEVLQAEEGGRMTMEVCGSMHERKLRMAKLSSGGFIVLPGGYGTFEEALEMTTWNQLGIHRLPILILNIGGFYTHMQAQFEAAVEAGFIAKENLSLVKLVNLEGEGGNGDEGRAGEWGDAAVKALEEWSFGQNVGYGLNWTESEKKEARDGTTQRRASPYPAATPPSTPPSVFTTMRYTSPHPSPPDPAFWLSDDDIPLVRYHFQRLREAHKHFRLRSSSWARYPEDPVIWSHITSKLKDAEAAAYQRNEPGDWRVRVVLQREGGIEVQALPAPAGAGPFQWHPAAERPAPELCRPVMLDPELTRPEVEGEEKTARRLYKTSERGIYDAASARGERISNEHPEVILRTSTNLLETATSNIAILLTHPDPSFPPVWVTPRITHSTPLLNGVMRRFLLDEGVLVEGDLTEKHWESVKNGEGRVIGFNGLRGVWEGRIV